MLDSQRATLTRDLIRARDAHARALTSTPLGCSPNDERAWAYELENLRWWYGEESRIPGVREAMRAHHTWHRWAEEFEDDEPE